MNQIPEVIVKDVTVKENGDLIIIFSNSLVLECFIAISINEECWRFFKYGAEEHMIVYGDRIDMPGVF